MPLEAARLRQPESRAVHRRVRADVPVPPPALRAVAVGHARQRRAHLVPDRPAEAAARLHGLALRRGPAEGNGKRPARRVRSADRPVPSAAAPGDAGRAPERPDPDSRRPTEGRKLIIASEVRSHSSDGGGAMHGSSAWRSVVARSFSVGAVAGVLLLLGCSSSSDEPTHLVVRTASGAPIDLTGTTWSECRADEPSAGMSRSKGAKFGAGTFTSEEVIFTQSIDCTGRTEPALGRAVTAQAAAHGDREAGWESGPPAGLPATVTGTAVLLSGFSPADIPDVKTLYFVNDQAPRQTLHSGGSTVALDGYPSTLQTVGKARVAQ